MPIGSLKTTTAATTAPKSDKSATASSSSAGPGGGGRTTFRPPWVKADVPEAKPKTTIKTTPPWAKKTTTTTPTAAATETANNVVKKNGETPLAKVTSPSSSASTKPATAAASKIASVVAKPLTDAAPPRREAKLQSREIKVPIITEKRKPIQEPLIKPKPKKPPTPPESEEEEEEDSDDDDDDDDETETESESEEEEDSSPPKEAATELERKFQAEKPKMRPIVVKRDKSLSCTQKKRDEEDDDDAEEGETEEDREKRRRFKLERPKLRHVVVNKQKSFNKSIDDFDKIRPVLKKVQKVDEVIKEPPSDAKPEFKDKVLKKVTPVKKDPSKANVPAPPPLPSLVPKPPPPPPPPLGPPSDFERKALNEKQKATIEKLKTRPRRRPDWSEMMKEVEDGKKLRHVQCNDRSQPIITCKSMTKVDDKFVYETEKDNAHNKLLKQIQGGIRLKSVKTNDRSKPFLDGLRKFRRQMTIEEQIQKSESKATLNEVPQEPDEPSGDELDDIDKLRDDLQSTKQMLALELRNREAQERENKRLLAKIANLEAELQRDKTRSDKDESSPATPSSSSSGADDVLVESLKKDAEEARKTSKELEKKYEKSAEELDAAKNEVEEQKRMIQQLEKKLSQALQQSPVSNHIRPQFSFCYSFEDPSEPDTYYNFNSASETDIQQAEPPQQTNNIKHISNHITNCMNSLKGGGSSINGSRRPSEANPNKESSPELELELSESEDDEDEEKKAERKKRRLAKEVKILQTKLTKLKDKQEAAKRERANLKQIMKKNHVLLKEENKKFKKLEKEVHKMAASMKEEVDEDDEEKDEDEEDEEEEAEEEQESEEESEEESESEESEDESGSETESESEAEDASDEDKKTNLEPRVKKHENRLSALKKGNVLLQANVDNLQDEISKVREKASSLQAELDSVLADLGL